jgi:hypothetical protein
MLIYINFPLVDTHHDKLLTMHKPREESIPFICEISATRSFDAQGNAVSLSDIRASPYVLFPFPINSNEDTINQATQYPIIQSEQRID